MEHSLNPSMEKTVSGSANEESGWTSYFEEFSLGMEQQSYYSSLGGSSLVSDAASSAAWKLSHDHNDYLVSNSAFGVRDSPNVLNKKLCFKKTRAQQISDDDSLEDTASSPVNSPKLGDLKVSSKIDDQIDCSTSGGKGFKPENYPKLQTDDCGINFNENNTECNTDLKKKGLCLVPLSMLVNYYV